MKKNLMTTFWASVLGLTLASCSPSSVNSLLLEGASPQLVGITLQQEATFITVTNQSGKALEQAEILIGTSVDKPFSGNLLTTNSEGQAALPEAWTEATPVTVRAKGYVPVTYLNQKPGALDFRLRPLPPRFFLELRGQAGPLPVKNGDGLADFALVMPALTRMDMLSFDVTKVISKEMDIISTMGQKMPVPSNISIPKQTERYGIINVPFEKPIYRTHTQKAGRNRIYAVQGVFPFKATADALRSGKSYFDIINSFTVTAGAVRDVTLKNTDQPQGLNLPTSEMVYDKARYSVGPRYGSDEYYLAVSLAEQSGFLVPTDFKKLAPNEKLPLRVHVKSGNMFLGVLKKKADLDRGIDRMSAALVRFNTEAPPKLLPLIGNPKVSGDTIVLPKVSTVSGISPVATYAMLSSETVVRRGKIKDILLNPVWEVYADEWISEFELPQWSGIEVPRGAKRWEINVIGSQTTSQAPVGPAMLDSATHVTHSSETF